MGSCQKQTSGRKATRTRREDAHGAEGSWWVVDAWRMAWDWLALGALWTVLWTVDCERLGSRLAVCARLVVEGMRDDGCGRRICTV